MLSPSVQVSTRYLPKGKNKQRNREENLHLNPRKKDRHKLNFKTRHWVRFLSQENYHLTLLEKIFKKALSGGCRFSYIALRIDNKNLFFLKNRPTEVYYLEKQKDFLFSRLFWRQKAELDNLLAKHPYQFRKKWQEIKAQVEILSQWDNPAKLVPGYKENGRPKPTWEGTGWNSPTYWEPKNRSLAALAFMHEIVLGKVGTETPLLDLDPNKKDKGGNYKIKQAWLRKDLSERGKKWKALINKHQIPYYWKTATPGNSLLPIPYWLIGSMGGKKIYHQDTHQEIGDLLGQGDLVALPVGSDKSRQLVITKWGKQLVKKYGIEGILRKKLLDGDAEKGVERLLNAVFLTLDKSSVSIRPKPKLITPKYLTENKGDNPPKLKLQAKLLIKYKTPLDKIWKVFYLNQKSQTKGYFLVNGYQREREFDNLNLGSIQNIYLVQGYKHQFLSRILLP